MQEKIKLNAHTCIEKEWNDWKDFLKTRGSNSLEWRSFLGSSRSMQSRSSIKSSNWEKWSKLKITLS